MDDMNEPDVGLSSEAIDAVDSVGGVTREEVYGNLEGLNSFADRQSLRMLKEMREEARAAAGQRKKSGGLFSRRTDEKAANPADIFANKINAFVHAPVNTMADLLVGVRLVARAAEDPSQRDDRVATYLKQHVNSLFSLTDDYRNNFLQVLAYIGDFRTSNLALAVVKDSVKTFDPESDEFEEGEAPDVVVKFLLGRNYFGDAMADTATHRGNHQIATTITAVVEDIAPGNNMALEFHIETILKRNKYGRLNFDYVNRNRRFIQAPVISELMNKHAVDMIREDLRFNNGQLTKSGMERAIRGDSQWFDIFFPNPAHAIIDVGPVDEHGHDWIDEILVASNDECFARVEPLFMKYGEIVFGDPPAKSRTDRISRGSPLFDAVQSYFRDRRDIDGKTPLHLAVENFNRDSSDNLIVIDTKRWLLEDPQPMREQISRLQAGEKKARMIQQLLALEAANVDRLDERDNEGMNVFHSAMMKDKLEPLRLLFTGFTNDQMFRILSKMVTAVGDSDEKKRMLFYGLARNEENRGSRSARYVMKLATECKFEERFKELMQKEKAKRRAQQQGAAQAR